MSRVRERRASALFTVLVVVSVASLLSAAVLTTGDSTATAADRQAERMSLRAIAWSGVQAAMSELAKQREDLLAGGTPTLTTEVSLRDEGAERPIARLVAWPGADERSAAVYAISESAKLDLNRATPEMLIAMGVPEATAQAIVGRRTVRAFGSAEELASVPGIAAKEIFPAAPKQGDGPLDAAALPPLTAMLTTLSFDPNVQAGLASDDAAGKLRINVGRGWNEELGKVLTEQLGDGAADGVKRLLEQSKGVKDDGALAGAMKQFGVPQSMFAAAFDALTVSDDLFVPGRVDLNHAEERVLAAVPGIGPEKAKAIVGARAQLTEDERRSRVWPLTRGVLNDEEFGKAVGWLTTRSTQWRVRVEAAMTLGTGPDRKIVRSATFDAVIDVASDRPRVAYMREVTLLPIAMAMETRVSTLAKSLADMTLAAPSPQVAEPAPVEEIETESTPDTRPETKEEPAPTAPPAADQGTMVDRRTGRWKASGRSN